jgi:hypothetical protein
MGLFEDELRALRNEQTEEVIYKRKKHLQQQMKKVERCRTQREIYVSLEAFTRQEIQPVFEQIKSLYLGRKAGIITYRKSTVVESKKYLNRWGPLRQETVTSVVISLSWDQWRQAPPEFDIFRRGGKNLKVEVFEEKVKIFGGEENGKAGKRIATFWRCSPNFKIYLYNDLLKALKSPHCVWEETK